VGKL
jgi:hypothetical protein